MPYLRDLCEQFIVPKLSPGQYGFLKGRSTEDAVLNVEHSIRCGLGRSGRAIKGTVSVVSFDISKAFDSVPFIPLLHRLRHDFGMPDS